MADTFPLSGNIDPKTFAFLLVDLHRRSATGSLKVEGPSHPKALYFRSGRVLFGSSNDPKDQLGAILIENGKITQEQLDDVNTKVGPGNPLAKVLAESGYVNQRELGEAARVKVERILSDIIAYETGSFEFEDGVLPKGAVDLKLSTEKLLLAAVARISDRGFVLRHLDSMATVLLPAEDWEARAAEFRNEVAPLMERLDGKRSLKEAVGLTRFDEFEGAKLACGLLFLGLVTKAAGQPAAAGAEVDLGAEARGAFGGDEESPTLPGASPDVDAPFFSASDSPFPAATSSPSAASAAAEPAFPAFGGGATPAASADAFPAADSFLTGDTFPSPDVFGSEPTAPGLPGPFASPRPSQPTGFSLPEKKAEAKGFAMSSGPELGFEETTPTTPPPFSVSTPPPPTTAELPAMSARSPEPAPVPASRPSDTAPPPSYLPPPVHMASDEPVTVPPSRPSKEDLAALDALLNPSSMAPPSTPASPPPSASINPSASMRMRSPVPRPQAQQRWEPQFRPPSQSGARRAAPPRRRVLPLVIAALLVLVVSAAGYFFLFPASPTRTTRATPPPSLAHTPPVASAAPSPDVDAPASAAPPSLAPTTTATPPPVAAQSAAPPTPPPATAPPATAPPATAPPATAPPATAPPATTPPRATAGDARGLLRKGEFGPAAQGFLSEVKRAGTRYSVQVLVACSTETIQKAMDNAPSDELFILPVNYNGKSCYRICWGLYESADRATAALQAMPPYFRQGGAKPKVSPASSLLP